MSEQPASGGGPLRALIFLLVAILMGCGAMLGLYQLISTYQERIDEAKRPEDKVMVIVAARDLYQGVTITEDDLYAVQIPLRFLPDGVYLSPEHVVGRIPRERILANEFVRADRLSDPEAGIGLNAVIPRGMRAISVTVKDGAALSGFLNPGSYVDTLVTIMPDKEGEDPKTSTLLQAVFVLGVNGEMRRSVPVKEVGDEDAEKEEKKKRRGPPSVTLLVTADQAEQLAHAENLGELHLSLRNDLDINFSNLEGVDISDLRRKIEVKKEVSRRPVAAKAAPVANNCIEVKMVQGGQTKIVLVDATTGVPCP